MPSGSNNSGQGGLLYDAALIIEIVQLCQKVNRPHDPVEGKQQLVEGLARLAEGDYGLCVVGANGDFSKPLLTVSVMSQSGARGKSRVSFRRASPTITDQLLDTARQAANHHPSRTKKGASLTHHIVSIIGLDDDGTKAAIVLKRRPKRPDFSASDHGLVDLLHSQMRWIYKMDLPLASQEALSLPPRPRQTLQYLLAGYSEKEAAAALDLSPNTVHHYVKQLYRHFGVSSRSELLAKWVRE